MFLFRYAWNFGSIHHFRTEKETGAKMHPAIDSWDRYFKNGGQLFNISPLPNNSPRRLSELTRARFPLVSKVAYVRIWETKYLPLPLA